LQNAYEGITGATIPVYFLDTNLQENAEYDRGLTSFLYGGDQWYRLCQEIILGIGGVRAIEAIGYQNIGKYHMNEGHASLLALELLERTKKDGEEDIYKKYDLESVKNKCIFTTHTPVAAGHDRFPLDVVKRALRNNLPFEMPDIFIRDKDKWLEIMRHAIALNASFFNTQRMVQEYVLNAYL
jgi:starch phosphorylase